jgi:hypothetical protein
VKAIISVCKSKEVSEHLFWGKVAAVNLSNDTSLTVDYMAQLLKQTDKKDALKISLKKSGI